MLKNPSKLCVRVSRIWIKFHHTLKIIDCLFLLSKREPYPGARQQVGRFARRESVRGIKIRFCLRVCLNINKDHRTGVKAIRFEGCQLDGFVKILKRMLAVSPSQMNKRATVVQLDEIWTNGERGCVT